MSRTITIDPVTRIEGHSKITIQLDDRGEVVDAHFHVTQFRGFERIVQGRPVHEMPAIMARICGICPVSHLVASAKAVDDILAVDPPPTGADLRRLINLGQIVQSNALSFFHLSSPDLLFGFDADPSKRHIVAVAQENPQLAMDGIRLRKWGQVIIELLGGKRIHPSGIVPGGVADPLSEEVRDQILAGVPEAIAQVERAIAWYKSDMMRWEEEASTFGNFRSAFMGLVDRQGNVDHYGGWLRVVDADGKALADRVDPHDFNDYIGEAVEPWSYLKSTYWKPMGYPDGIYRVGPLARLNVAEATGTPRADEELQKFRWRVGRVAGSSFHYHYARLIDTLHAVEKIEQILRGPDILSRHVRATAGINRNEGIGVSEAPRGTLMHHYKVDDNGLVEWANLVIATGHNNMAMNRSVQQVARHHVKGEKIEEPMLNRVEAVIRCYDPCLSCSTHALGDMALDIQLLSPAGEVLDRVRR
ncbi:MAG TPA: Ni/Fe hydrogenase subunit alpha [Anaerolineae bacterium]|jgi:NAD-reducing hydrogenase large subunit|nr:Ni/Fe hydrogenase subunit alpha [Anaerolineae bacterium]